MNRPRFAPPQQVTMELTPAERALLAAVRSLEYGRVEVVVQARRVVRLEKTEQTRYDPK